MFFKNCAGGKVATQDSFSDFGVGSQILKYMPFISEKTKTSGHRMDPQHSMESKISRDSFTLEKTQTPR